jgi:hypothetical protein
MATDYGSYFQSLLDQGIISKDNVLNGSDAYGGTGNQWYKGTDNNLYNPVFYQSQTMNDSGTTFGDPYIGYISKTPFSNIDPSTGKDIPGSTSYFLDPKSGAQVGTGQANYAQIDPGEWAAIAMLSAIGGGAAMGAAGVGGAAAGSSTATGGAGGFIGEGAASGIGAWDGALGAAPAWTAGGAGAAGAAFNPAVDSQLANTQLGLTASDVSGGVGSTAASTSGTSGMFDSLGNLKSGVTDALKGVGLNKDSIGVITAALASLNKSGGSGGGSVATPGAQGSEAASFLEQVLPYLRTNSTNPGASATWSRAADGTYTLNNQLTGSNKDLYDTASSKLAQFMSTIDPNAKPPALLDSAEGNYQSDLAKTIYDRTMGLQSNDIDTARKAQEARLAEQGFIVGNEGYNNEMNRWEDNLGEARNNASKDAQIQAATQALADANFTNTSRTSSFNNSQALQQQIASILAGAKNNATSALTGLTSTSAAPTGNPASTTAQGQLANDLSASKNQSNNDLIRALLNWGIS